MQLIFKSYDADHPLVQSASFRDMFEVDSIDSGIGMDGTVSDHLYFTHKLRHKYLTKSWNTADLRIVVKHKYLNYKRLSIMPETLSIIDKIKNKK